VTALICRDLWWEEAPRSDGKPDMSRMVVTLEELDRCRELQTGELGNVDSRPCVNPSASRERHRFTVGQIHSHDS
jgi:hypothetical protein